MAKPRAPAAAQPGPAAIALHLFPAPGLGTPALLSSPEVRKLE